MQEGSTDYATNRGFWAHTTTSVGIHTDGWMPDGIHTELIEFHLN